MSQFAPSRDPLPPPPPAEHRGWRWLLLGSAALGAVASTQPWVQVRFARLFGELFGPPAWQSSAGFTALCTCALVAVMALAETHSRASRQAVRPASLVLVVVMALSLLLHSQRGPGTLRGVSAAWTISFYLGLTATAALATASVVRFLRMQHGDPEPFGARSHDDSMRRGPNR